MNNISGYLSLILSAVYGRDVRQAIHDAIAQCYDDVSNVSLNSEAFKTALAEAIEDGTLTALNVADQSITEDKLADNSVTTEKLKSSSVTTEKIVNAAVTTAKLLDAAVTEAKLANGSVTTEKIMDKSVTEDKLSGALAALIKDTRTNISQVQELYKALNATVLLLASDADNYANGWMWSTDGMLYLTHDGVPCSSGLDISASGGGGLNFNSGYQDEAGYIHLTMDGEDIEGFDPFYVAGGSGNGTTGSKIVFAMYSASAFSVLSTSESAPINFKFTSVDAETGTETGSGNLSIYVGGILKQNLTVSQGDNTIDVFDYLASGSNTVKLVMTDTYGASASRTITITVESFVLEWNLGNTEKNTGTLAVRVTPTGSGTKTLYLSVDGVVYETRKVTTSGTQVTFSVTLAVGAHTISCYGEMAISGVTLTSDTLVCEVAQVSESSTATVIAVKMTEKEYSQYSTVNLPVRVVNPTENPTAVVLMVDGVTVSSDEWDQTEHTWTYRFTETGEIVLSISAGGYTWSKSVTVSELETEIEEITDDLALKIDPNKISDIDAFDYNGTTMSVSQGFDSHNGGLVTDDDGVRCIKVSKGDTLTINYNLFAIDARTNGRNIKIIYKTDIASDFDGNAISCMSGGIGIEIKANSMYVSTEQTSLSIDTCEGKKTELELNIEPSSADRLMMLWEKGVPAGTTIYATNDNIKQSSPVGITVGSDTCDVYLYLLRVYTRDLTVAEIKANFIYDGKDATEITERSDRNDVYDSSGKLDPDLVATNNPNLHVMTWHAAGLSTAKSQKITGTLTHKYVSGGAAHSWTAKNVVQKAQGTSSLGYVDAGCNEDFSAEDGFDFEDGTHLNVYSMTENSIGVNYFNFKTNVASQEHINNIALAEWYNKHQPYLRKARRNDGRVRDTVEGHLAVLFFHNTGDTAFQMGPYSVQPDETVLYSLGCLNNSKSTEEVFQYSDIVIELRNNTSDQCRFKSDDLSGEDWSGDVNFEFRYLNEDVYTKAEAAAIFQKFLTWFVSMDSTQATDATFGTQKTINGQVYTADTAEYRKAAFYAEAADHMVIDSFTYDQNFNLIFSQVDNNVKNVFFDYDSNTGLWSVVFAYDRDTGMGNDNEGGMTLKYGYMDTDTIGTRDVFNGADATFRCMVRECFSTELHDMYIEMENSGCCDLDSFADYCDTIQNYACESLWIEDAYRKCIDTYINLGTTAYISMQTGKKRLQRRQFLHYQRPFISSYYIGSYVTTDNATIRAYTPSQYAAIAPSSKMTIIPYSDLWIVVRAGSQDYQIRGYAGQKTEIVLGTASFNDSEVYVRAARFIADLGELAHLYPGYIDVSACIRLQRLHAGSSEEGYYNTNLTDLTVKNAQSLQYVNVEGCSNLAQELDLSNNIYVRECYTRGSGVTGVTFADYGRLEIAYLNAVASIYANNLYHVQKITLEDYAKLTTLNVVAGVLDALAIAIAATNLNRVRLKDMDWSTTISAYKHLLRLHEADGIDDDGHTVDNGVLTGSCYFEAISQTKYDTLVESITTMDFSYGVLLDEHTVRFYDKDGTFLYSEKVEHGGTADDPVEEGYIDAPANYFDDDYVYSYYKWSVSLANITDDTDVYATYSRATRINSVTYVDYDGTILEVYEVPAHGSCRYQGIDLARSGYVWVGWDKTTEDVTENMTVTAVYVYPALPPAVLDLADFAYAYSDDANDNSAYSYSELYAIINTGQAADYLPQKAKVKFVMDTDAINDINIEFNVHSYGHYELADGTGTMSNVDFYMTGVLISNRQMNTTNTNVGGWDASALRAWLNDTFRKAMPITLRNLVKKSITLANAGNQSSEIIASEDWFRIPATAEVRFDTTAVPYKDEVSEKAAEIAFDQYVDNASRIKGQYNGEGSAQTYWTRSAEAGGVVSFRYVYSYGSNSSNSASSSYGVCVGFSG